jgi:MFS family permease
MRPSQVVSTRETLAAIRSQRLLRLLYILIAFLYWSALYLYVPTLPTYVQSRGEDLALVGIVLSQYGLWQAFIRLPLGIAADSLGRRKPFIVAGIVLAGLGAWLMGAAEETGGLLVGRAITGLAAGTWVPLTVAFSSLFPAAQAIRATAILTFVGSAGRMIASGVTGSLNELGGYVLAFNLAACVAAVALLFVLPVREPSHPPRRPSRGGISRLITRRDVLVPSLLAAVSQYANWAITFSFMPILAEHLGATDITLSLLPSMHIGVVTAMTLVTATVVARVGARRLVYATFLLVSCGIGLGALAPSLVWVFVAQFCLGVAQGLGYPVLMGLSIRDVDDVERTTAMGLHQSVYAIGMFAGPWLGGLLADALGLRPMFGVTAAACLVAATLLVRLLPDLSQPTPRNSGSNP